LHCSSESIYANPPNEKGWLKVGELVQSIYSPQVVCSSLRGDTETFSLMSVSASEVRDLDFVNDAAAALKLFVERIRAAQPIGQREKRFQLCVFCTNMFCSHVIKLLTLCIYFVTGTGLNSYVDPLELSVPAKMKKSQQQKLLREQGVLDEVFKLLKVRVWNTVNTTVDCDLWDIKFITVCSHHSNRVVRYLTVLF
jgi:hypothetical protein